MTENPKTLPVLVVEEGRSRAGFSGVDAIAKVAATTVKNFDVDKLKGQIEDVIGAVVAILPEASPSTKGYGIDQISFTVGIQSSGKVAIVSVAELSALAQLGIQFTLKRQIKND